MIFAEQWWLDAVAPGQWEEVVASDEPEGSGRLIYVPTRHWSGLNILSSPPLTPRLGPLVDLPSGEKEPTRLARLKTILTQLIELLPDSDHFSQECASDFTYWLPFYWADFNQTTRYSYVLGDLTDIDAVWSGMSQSHRRKIRNGRKHYTLRYDLDADVLIDLVHATYDRRGLTLDTDPATIRRVHDAGDRRDAGRLVAACDARGRPVAAAYVVWDSSRMFYLLGGRSDHDGPDAMPLVLWDCIELAARVSTEFDFEGSMHEGIEQFFRGFGGSPEPYFSLSRTNRRMTAARWAGNLIKSDSLRRRIR